MAQYKIQKGDTLSHLAKRFNTSVAELMKANPQIKDANKIYYDRMLTVPGEQTGAQAAPAAQASAKVKVQKAAEPVQSAGLGGRVIPPKPLTATQQIGYPDAESAMQARGQGSAQPAASAPVSASVRAPGVVEQMGYPSVAAAMAGRGPAARQQEFLASGRAESVMPEMDLAELAVPAAKAVGAAGAMLGMPTILRKLAGAAPRTPAMGAPLMAAPPMPQRGLADLLEQQAMGAPRGYPGAAGELVNRTELPVPPSGPLALMQRPTPMQSYREQQAITAARNPPRMTREEIQSFMQSAEDMRPKYYQ